MNAVLSSAFNVALLAIDSQQAAQLRLFRLGLGGASAIEESMLMMTEKIEAFGKAAGFMLLGGSFDGMVDGYRSIVRANIQRLSFDSRTQCLRPYSAYK